MNRTKAKLLLLLATGVVVKTAWGQDAAKQQPPSASEGPAKICEPPRENLPREHRFWDKENRWLFAGVGAARTLDYFSTLNMRSEEHTSELQSRLHLVCRLLLEKKKKTYRETVSTHL